MERAIFAGGCFWCTEAYFLELEGVEDINPGYIGGHQDHPGQRARQAGQAEDQARGEAQETAGLRHRDAGQRQDHRPERGGHQDPVGGEGPHHAKEGEAYGGGGAHLHRDEAKAQGREREPCDEPGQEPGAQEEHPAGESRGVREGPHRSQGEDL